MATHPLLLSQAVPDRETPRAQLPGTAQRDLLSQQDRLPVAQPAGALCAVGHGLSLLPSVETHGTVGGDSWAFARASAFGGGAPAARQRRHPRQSERQKHGEQRRAGLRCGQENQRAQAPPSRGHDGTHLAGPGVAREHPGPGRRQATAEGVLWPVGPAAAQTPLGRWRLHGSAGGLGASSLALHRGDREAVGLAHVPSAAAPLGRGTHLLVAGALPPLESRLRTPSPHRRSYGLSGHDPIDAGALGRKLMSFQTRSKIIALLIHAAKYVSVFIFWEIWRSTHGSVNYRCNTSLR